MLADRALALMPICACCSVWLIGVPTDHKPFALKRECLCTRLSVAPHLFYHRSGKAESHGSTPCHVLLPMAQARGLRTLEV